MSDLVACPFCQTQLSVTPETAGLVVSCPTCGNQFQMPAAQVAHGGEMAAETPIFPGVESVHEAPAIAARGPRDQTDVLWRWNERTRLYRTVLLVVTLGTITYFAVWFALLQTQTISSGLASASKEGTAWSIGQLEQYLEGKNVAFTPIRIPGLDQPGVRLQMRRRQGEERPTSVLVYQHENPAAARAEVAALPPREGESALAWGHFAIIGDASAVERIQGLVTD